jgi:hypothetical protein
VVYYFNIVVLFYYFPASCHKSYSFDTFLCLLSILMSESEYGKKGWLSTLVTRPIKLFLFLSMSMSLLPKGVQFREGGGGGSDALAAYSTSG